MKDVLSLIEYNHKKFFKFSPFFEITPFIEDDYSENYNEHCWINGCSTWEETIARARRIDKLLKDNQEED